MDDWDTAACGGRVYASLSKFLYASGCLLAALALLPLLVVDLVLRSLARFLDNQMANP